MRDKVFVPPLKIQGIKTKIVNLISENMSISSKSVWYEPFLGSGVVGFNLAPQKALFSDTNPHIISLYRSINEKKITSQIVRDFLEYEGSLLKAKDEEHYYYVRERFNEKHDPLDFLFLNRSCFNGMIRFNKDYKFNVPYGHKPERFAKAYISKIVNQVKHLEAIFPENDWNFECCSFEKTIAKASVDDFIYCDPPYIGRHVDYYDDWDEEKEYSLNKALINSGAKFILSTWDHNKYRNNEYLDKIWGGCRKVLQEHFYHVGAKEQNRNSVFEALIMNYD